MKIAKATVIKFVVAAIIPGGFILWGLHEISRRYRENDKKHDDSSDKSRDTTSLD